jgi:O-antigen ligase
MSTTAGAWTTLAVLLLALSFRRPAWAVALYMLTFFASPHLWWWGDELPSIRYALWAGVVLVAAVLWYLSRSPEEDSSRRYTLAHAAAIAMVLNATIVHSLLAVDLVFSLDTYVELLKYVLLFFLIWSAIRNKRDFRLVLISVALGAAYIGYEVTINERGRFDGTRLEGVGAPGADSSNGLASLMLTVLPLIGALFVGGTKREKLLVVMAAPLALNVLLVCNSRGAFLGLVGAGLTFVLLARGATRKKAIGTLLLGSAALYVLMGDPEILDRFATTFTGSEERDRSADSRLAFWRGGLLMIRDYPLGAGGASFKYVLGPYYLAQVSDLEEYRSLHNGYLTEATDWGVQGLFLKLLFIGAAVFAAYRTSTRCRLAGRVEDSLMGLSLVVSTIGFLITSIFGSYLASEWTYWNVAFLISYSQLYSVATPSSVAIDVAPVVIVDKLPRPAA